MSACFESELKRLRFSNMRIRHHRVKTSTEEFTVPDWNDRTACRYISNLY